MTQVVETSIPALLRERAYLQPDDTALTFVDYDKDWDGVPESLTWPQLYRRVLNVARELRLSAAPGDRAMIVAPQGLEYIVAFLGALEAGLIPAPLAAPFGGAADERVASVLRDAQPTAVLTTSPIVAAVAQSITEQPGRPTPAIIEVDRLDLDASPGSGGSGVSHEDEYQSTAYLQYTSGSTRSPAGVMISYKNVLTNLQQICTDYLADGGLVNPPTIVSWLPFYHDLGLLMGICTPVIAGFPTVVTSPLSFLQRPARWMQLAARYPNVFTSGPNFALDLAARKTSDEDMAGLDLGDVLLIQSGAERVNPTTVRRFLDRFARFNLRETVMQPSYGLAEATLYLATPPPDQPMTVVHFDSDSLTTGKPQRCGEADGSTPLVSYGSPISPISPVVRIVDPETAVECPEGTTGEIWAYGDNVSAGYWEKLEETERTFGGTLVDPAEGTPEGPWLKTGDLGFISAGELFIVGRIKDLLIVYGRNHAPDDIEATITEITNGRCVAIAVPNDGVEQLVAILEIRTRGDSDEDAMAKLAEIKREVTSAISNSHGLAVSDLVLVAQGSIPVTTSGKVRRQSCVDLYQRDQFTRLDA